MVLTGQKILYCSENIDNTILDMSGVSTSTALSTFSQHILSVYNECGYVDDLG